jgi:pyruvate kinase
MQRRRRTKIVATLGPALDAPEILESLISAGADVFRANFSHGTLEEHAQRIQAVRAAAEKNGKEVTVFADLQGPKIRIAQFSSGPIQLAKGDQFIIDVALEKKAGDQQQVGCEYKQLTEDVSANDVLLLDDGRLVFKVTAVEGSKVICQVDVGGELSDYKGINRRGGGLSAAALTEKDKRDITAASKLAVDYFAVSFPRSAEDIEEAKELIAQADSHAGVIAKIERVEAITNLEEIIKASDVVMVARGDLAVEIGDAEVPGAQKEIIHKARILDKAVITATQMMESMVSSSVPTRAEVSDVANAVLDGTDAVMLSEETAVGEFPLEVVQAVNRVCLSAEKQPSAWLSGHRMECYFTRPDEAIAMAAMYTANHFNTAAIVALTESGATPLWMSRIRTGIPIFALTKHKSILRKINIYRGVYPMRFDMTTIDRRELNRSAADFVKEKGFLDEGDSILITKGDMVDGRVVTNSVKIFTV